MGYKRYADFKTERERIEGMVKIISNGNVRIDTKSLEDMKRLYKRTMREDVPKGVDTELLTLETLNALNPDKQNEIRIFNNVKNTLLQLQVTLNSAYLYTKIKQDFAEKYSKLEDSNYIKQMATQNLKEYKRMFEKVGINSTILDQVEWDPSKSESENGLKFGAIFEKTKDYYYNIIKNYLRAEENKNYSVDVSQIMASVKEVVDVMDVNRISIEDVFEEDVDLKPGEAPSTYAYDNDGRLMPLEKPAGFLKGLVFSIKRFFNKKEAERIINEQNEFDKNVEKFDKASEKIIDQYDTIDVEDNTTRKRIDIEKAMIDSYDVPEPNVEPAKEGEVISEALDNGLERID